MANKIPPAPVGALPGSSYWNDWVEKLRNLVNSGTIVQLWSSINFSGSNITDIVTRNHNNLQSFQGGMAGEYYHLTSAQHTALADNVSRVMLTKAGTPTTSDIAAGNWAVYKDTSGGTVRVWCNDGGVMKSVTLT